MDRRGTERCYRYLVAAGGCGLVSSRLHRTVPVTTGTYRSFKPKMDWKFRNEKTCLRIRSKTRRWWSTSTTFSLIVFSSLVFPSVAHITLTFNLPIFMVNLSRRRRLVPDTRPQGTTCCPRSSQSSRVHVFSCTYWLTSTWYRKPLEDFCA
jgi:hypothetical protein